MNLLKETKLFIVTKSTKAHKINSKNCDDLKKEETILLKILKTKAPKISSAMARPCRRSPGG